MNRARLQSIAARYPDLRIAVVGDFCLDRYLEIDPAREELSLETGLAVHNVVRVRGQPGGAGTILNNLVALGIGRIVPIGFVGQDGEGHELWKALSLYPGIELEYLERTAERQTFTYCKPLMMTPGQPPKELNRLDFKNWTPTPAKLRDALISNLKNVAPKINALIVLDQADVAETGVVTARMIEELVAIAAKRPAFPILADSRRSLANFSNVTLKMNATELASLMNRNEPLDLDEAKLAAATLAKRQGRPAFVTLAESGLVAASPEGTVEHESALPLRSKAIDVVGAGDAVTANLAAALSAGATLREAIELANRAASVVIHKLGTTGTASVAEIAGLLD